MTSLKVATSLSVYQKKNKRKGDENLTFTSLPNDTKGYVTAAVAVGFIALTLALITNIATKRDKGVSFVLSFALTIAFVDLAALIELINLVNQSGEPPISTVALLFNNIPFYLQLAVGLAATVASVFTIYNAFTHSKNTINDFSVKEALESLPSGIAFVSDSNDIHLSNQIMHKLWRELTGKELISGTDIWGALCKFKDSDKCVLDEDSPAFILQGGKVWQFARTLWENYTEIKATDITELYSLRQNNEQVGKTLTQRHKRLKALADIIEKTTEEETALDLKVGLHDNFGSLLLLTKQTLIQSTEVKDTKTVVGEWSKLPDMITGIATDEKSSMSLEEIVMLGEKLGCKLVVNGDLPSDHEQKTTILLCINEALKNAYRHANANKLTVSITENTETITVTLQNETKSRITEILEGGGLTGLRQRIENMGGAFSVKVENGVTIKLTLKKSRELEVGKV